MSKELLKTRRRKKNIAVGLGVFGLVILFYVVTVTRLGGF